MNTLSALSIWHKQLHLLCDVYPVEQGIAIIIAKPCLGLSFLFPFLQEHVSRGMYLEVCI